MKIEDQCWAELHDRSILPSELTALPQSPSRWEEERREIRQVMRREVDKHSWVRTCTFTRAMELISSSARVIAIIVCLCVSVCHTPVLYQNV